MRKSFIRAHRRRQRGYGLVEIGASLAIIGLLVALVMYAITTVNNARVTNDSLNQLAQVQQAIRSVYYGQPDYTGLTASILAASKQLPNRMVKGTALQSAFNSPINIGTANANQNYTIEFTNVTQDACSKMAAIDFGTALFSVNVNGTTVNGRGMLPAEANTACAVGGNGSDVTWTLY